jgi:hypothetical protein
MTFQDIQQMFNRAFWLSFSKRKLGFTFAVLVLCGLLAVFCRGLSLQAGEWAAMSLMFLPIFLCTGLLLSMGVVIIRAYHNEVKKREVSFKDILNKSWQLMIGTSYLAMPLLLGYLFLWILLGVFFLLKEIPVLGELIGVLLSFGPFLLILGSLVLVILNLLLLFFVTPAVGLGGSVDRLKVAQLIIKRLRVDIFSNFILLLIALVPLLIVVALLIASAMLTGGAYVISSSSVYTVLQWFFIMLPFAALLAPAVVFFFNFAAESHVLMKKKLSD